MKHIYKLIFLLFIATINAQVINKLPDNYLKNGITEDQHGNIVTDQATKQSILKIREAQVKSERATMVTAAATQKAVQMCSNGGFEQYETVGGSNFLKDFLYTIGDPLGPTQCRSITNAADTYIPQYNPTQKNLMATTVPANLVDEFMGDIKAFDQYALKINYTNSGTYGSLVQAKRFKTNNEDFVKFNYKAVLQTVYDTSHQDNQAFFKARVLDKNGKVVSEFCLVGDEKNCIFTKVPSGGYGYVTLYTANWQSGLLDISSIPNNEEFTVEFLASRCGLGGHFGYAYIDDICLLHTDENFIGSVTLDPLNAVCPTMPVSICGSYTLPNSGGISATLKSLTLNIYDQTGKVIGTKTVASSLDKVNKTFCFSLTASDLPNTTNAGYNFTVTADFDMPPVSCGSGNFFKSATSALNSNGFNVSFLNCNSACNIDVKTSKLVKCDVDKDGVESFDLTDLNKDIVVGNASGLNFSYFKTYNDAANNTNSIGNVTQYSSGSTSIYVRVYKDATCYKIISANLEVRNPSATITGILNVCSGSTILTASSGKTYLWSTGETTQKISVSSTGTYTVTVTDDYGCSSVASVDILPSQTAVLPTVEVTQPNCFVSSGTIKVTSPASSYSYDNGSTWVTSATKANLSPGTYYVMIKTVNGCISYPQEVKIVPSLLISPTHTSNNPRYCGDTGSITINTSAPYYSFDDGVTWGTDATKDQLQPGKYILRTKDNTGCISNPTVVMIESITLGSPDVSYSHPSCGNNGSITINTPADFYTFDGGKTWVTTNTLTNLGEGSYSISIKNKSNCTSYPISIYLRDYKNTNPDTETIQPSCGQLGTIYVKTIGDQYSYDNGATWVSSNTADLPAGNYLVKVKDKSGCISSAAYVSLYPPTLQQPFYSVIHPTCGVDGSITINTVSDFYSFDNGATWVTTNQKSLPAGSYQIKIKNSLGCTSSGYNVYLNEPRIPAPDISVVQGTCSTKGSITVLTPAAQYSIDGGYTWQTSPIFNNLNSYSYNVCIKNSVGCRSDIKYQSMNTAYLDTPTYKVTNPSCGNIGNITFTSQADFYTIDGGKTWSTSPIFNNLAKGYYTLLTKNNAGCQSQYYYVTLSDTNLAEPTYTYTPPTCTTSASITFTTVADYYSINYGQTWQTSSTFTNVSPGSYYLMIKSNGGCTSSSNTYVNVSQFYLPNPATTFTPPVDCITGGTITFNTVADFYSIDGGKTWQTSNTFTNIKSGYYDIMIKNTLGCTSQRFSITMPTYYLPNPNLKIEQPSCGKDGSITIVTPAAQYSFDGGQTWGTKAVLDNIKSGSFSVVIKNSSGCVSASMYISMNAYYLPRPIVKTEQPTCETPGSITVMSAAAQYSFDGGKTWGTSPSLIDPKPGSYTVMIKNSAGCISESNYVYIYQFNLSLPSSEVIHPTCDIPTGTIIIKTVADQYSFDGGKTWGTNPVKSNLPSGYYYIMIKNQRGCTSQSTSTWVGSPPSIPIAPTVTVVQPSSCGATDGSITITSYSGASYSFNDGQSWTTNPTKVNIGAGTYVIKVKNSAYSCESAKTVVTLNSGTPLPAPTFSVTQPACSTTTGSITITTAADTYSFDDGLSFVYSNTKTDLPPGTYKVKIRSASGCVSNAATVTITKQSALPAPTVKVSQPACGTILGSIEVTSAAAMYSFDNGLSFQPTNIKNNLPIGTYNIIIKDAAGCISLAAVATIDPAPAVPGAPQVSLSQPTGCGTSSQGSITVNSAATLYSFDDGATWVSSPSIKANAGVYMVRVKLTSAGCPSDATKVTINPAPNGPTDPTFSIVQPTSCVSPFGEITITSPSDWYSFDNGATYIKSNIASNLPAGQYQIKVKNAAGCESNPVSVTINKPTDYPPKPTAAVQQMDCNHPFGEIKINEVASEYSIDGGVTWQTSNLFTGLTAKKYSVVIKNNLGCISEVTSIDILPYTNNTPKPIANASQSFCIQQNALIQDIAISGSAITWYDSVTGGSILSSSTSLQNGKTYFASQKVGGCESERIAVKITINATPAPTGNALQEFCINQNATITNLNVIGSNIQWYTSSTGGIPVPNTTALQNGVTYYATQTLNGCESVQRLAVKVSIVSSNIPSNDYSTTLCAVGNDPLQIDLTSYGSNLVSNPSNYTFAFYDQNNRFISNPSNYSLPIGNNTFKVLITSKSGCATNQNLAIVLNPSPVIALPSTAEICNGGNIDLTVATGYDHYEWRFSGSIVSTNPNITISQVGTYELTVTSINGCATTKKIVISYLKAPNITNIKIEGHTVTIDAMGQGILEYSIDGMLWQSSNVFYDVANGTHQALVRNKNTPCAIAQKEFNIFIIPNVITPEGDYVNDDWKIEGLENYPGTVVSVFDRFQKEVLHKVVNGKFSWNGEFNGRKLPTATYWYIIKIPDGRVLTGYLVIKNRN